MSIAADPSPRTPGAPGGGDRPYGLWFPLALCLLLQVMVVAYGTTPVLEGRLMGADSYTRLNRVTQLHETGDWFDSTVPRSNAPYGDVLHWTRPFDALLLAGAWLGAPLTDFKTALFWSGTLVGPLLQFLVLIAVMWAAAPVLARHRIVFLGLLFLVNPAIVHYFFAGRADHHGLNLLLFVLSLGLVVRLLSSPYRAGPCHLAGILAAFSLWVSIEALAALVFNLAALTLFWVFTGRQLERKAFHFSGALVAGLAVALVLERPLSGILEVEYDRLSIVHLVLAGLAWAYWGLVLAAGRITAALDRPHGRLTSAVVWGVLAGGLMWAVFPGFFRGPLADMDPRIAPILFDRIIEVQPLVDPRNPALGPFVYWLGIALPALPFLAWMVFTTRRETVRTGFVYLSIGLAVFLPLAFYQVRWTVYPALLLLLPYAELLGRVFERTAPLSGGVRPLARAGVVAAFCGVFSVAGLALIKVERGIGAYSPIPAACRIDRVSAYLDDPDGWGDGVRTILAPVNFGPEILYRTRHRVVATPYHRNGRGIVDNHLILSATDDASAQALIEERRVDLVLLCPGATSDPAPGSLQRRLVERRGPPWLREVRLPEALGEGFRLFEVVR